MDEIVITSQRHNNQSRTLIRIGDASDDFPSHLLTGEKEFGYIYKDSKISKWDWINVIDIGEDRFIISEEIDILPFRNLADYLREDALKIVRDLAEFCLKLPEEFLDPYNGFIETWRIFFIVGGGFLILPDQLSQIILYCSDSDRRNKCYYHYLKPNTFFPFALALQFSQFLYFAAAKEIPYRSEDVRFDHWRHIPLSLGFSTLDKKSASWIDKTLTLDYKEQQKRVSAAYSAQENLKWFLEETKNLNWEFKEKGIVETTNYKIYLENLERRIKRKKFVKAKTPLFISIVITIVLAVSIIIGTNKKVTYSYDDSIKLIESFYTSLNNFNLDSAKDTLNRFTKNPYEKEVATLYIAQQMRKAYNPELAIESSLWETEDLMIKQLSENRYEVSYVKIIANSESETSIIFNKIKEVAIIEIKTKKENIQINKIELIESSLVDSFELKL